MKVEIILDPSLKDPEITIRTPQVNDQISRLCRLLQDQEKDPFVLSGVKNEKLEIIAPDSVIRIYAEDGKVWAETRKGKYRLHFRLYELEEMLNPQAFVRISSSEILALSAVVSFDLSFSGTICAELVNGQKAYVSRRYVGIIKQILGLRKGKRKEKL